MSRWDPFATPIVDPGAIRWTAVPGWQPDNVARCSSCKAPIRWCLNTASGRKAPFDPDGKTHFSSCPHADFHRERAAAKRAARGDKP